MTQDHMAKDAEQHRQGGKTVYGAAVGILMLETRFPRIPGDIGHAGTWPFPVLYRTVPGASPDLVVRRRAEGLLPAFIEAGRDLVRLGADGITTNCGFLSLFQTELTAALEVPVATSSLMQAPMIQALLPPGRRLGILTVSADSLTADHLEAAGVAADTVVVGTESGRAFTRALLENEASLDIAAAREDMLAAAGRLVAAEPKLGAILMECTNMVPYAADIRAAYGLPVYSIYSFIQWFHQGLLPRRFPTHLDDSRL